VREDLDGLFVAAARVEPARGLGDEKDTKDVDECRHTLEEEGGAPCPVAGLTTKGDGDTASEELADVVEGVEETHPSAAGCRGGDFGHVGFAVMISWSK
jgi:hypothetical protein